LKKSKRNKKFKKYWSLLEPKEYINKIVASSESFIKVAERLKEVKLYGKLTQAKEGFTYLSVSNNIIHGLFSLIREDGAEKPLYFGKKRGEYNNGAHISVMSSGEINNNKLEISEIGEEFPFKVIGIKSVKPKNWEEMERLWFVEVESPEIEKLRQKYKLPKTYEGTKNKLHLTIAVKKANKNGK